MVKTAYTCDRCGIPVPYKERLVESYCASWVFKLERLSDLPEPKRRMVQLCRECNYKKRQLDTAIAEASERLYAQFLNDEGKLKTEEEIYTAQCENEGV